MPSFSINKILAAIALCLALAAAVAEIPRRNNADIGSIAAMIETEKDHITPVDLARVIKSGKEKIRLIDLRDTASFNRYHIPGAESFSLISVFDNVFRNEKIVLYSEGGIHAAQAWVVLKTQRYPDVRTLLGGMKGWEDEILHPEIATALSDSERVSMEEKKELCRYFGGSPAISAESSEKKSVGKNPAPIKIIRPEKIQKEGEKLRETC